MTDADRRRVELTTATVSQAHGLGLGLEELAYELDPEEVRAAPGDDAKDFWDAQSLIRSFAQRVQRSPNTDWTLTLTLDRATAQGADHD